ncbi:MAG: hypothetical protein ACFFCW_43565 [Candidatus Hodarchaeota archaeon]
MEHERYIPFEDWGHLKAVGFPWRKSYAYKLKHRGTFPGLFLKIGGKVVVDTKVLDDMLRAEGARQRRKFQNSKVTN